MLHDETNNIGRSVMGLGSIKKDIRINKIAFRPLVDSLISNRALNTFRNRK